MSIGAAIYTLLSGDATLTAAVDKIAPGFAPPNTAGVYLTYFQVSGPRTHSLAGAQGLARTRWQFNVWAADQADVDAAKDALRRLLDGYSGAQGGTTFQGVFLSDEGELSDPSPDADAARVFGARQDYTIHAEETP